MNEAQRRGYKKVRITKHVAGWPVGSIVWHNGKGEAYNDDCSSFWCHTVGTSCEYVEDEKMKIEAGKYYKTRYGRVVGPMREWDTKIDGRTAFMAGDGGLWWEDGTARFKWALDSPTLIAPAYPEQGTLKEIGAKPGDVVELVENGIASGSGVGERGTVEIIDGEFFTIGEMQRGDDFGHKFRIVSRASDKPTSPVRTVTTTRREIVPGVYGRLRVSASITDSDDVCIEIVGGMAFSGQELTAAIATLTEIRDALT